MRQSGATLITGTSLCARLANGAGQEEVLVETGSNVSGPAHTLLSPQPSPDGRYLLYVEQAGPTGASVGFTNRRRKETVLYRTSPISTRENCSVPAFT